MNVPRLIRYSLILFGFLAWFVPSGPAYGQPLQVCATVPELGSLVEEVGGGHVAVTVFTKGTESPHFTVPKPSFIKALNACDVYVETGLELEVGWAPPLLQNARNAAILPGGPGYIDASVAITPLEVPAGPVDRSLGDIHPTGNPHYLLDPMSGLRVAGLLHARLSALRPDLRSDFAERYSDFRRRLGVALVGEALFQKYDFEKLAILARHGRLIDFLDRQEETELLGGWLAAMQHLYGSKVVGDHNVWVYFNDLFGLDMIAYLEPLPGISPTTKHLGTLVERMRAEHVNVVLATAFYDPRYAEFVAENTGAVVVPMANQAASRPGTEHYLAMVDYNVRQLSTALAGGR